MPPRRSNRAHTSTADGLDETANTYTRTCQHGCKDETGAPLRLPPRKRHVCPHQPRRPSGKERAAAKEQNMADLDARVAAGSAALAVAAGAPAGAFDKDGRPRQGKGWAYEARENIEGPPDPEQVLRAQRKAAKASASATVARRPTTTTTSTAAGNVGGSADDIAIPVPRVHPHEPATTPSATLDSHRANTTSQLAVEPSVRPCDSVVPNMTQALDTAVASHHTHIASVHPPVDVAVTTHVVEASASGNAVDTFCVHTASVQPHVDVAVGTPVFAESRVHPHDSVVLVPKIAVPNMHTASVHPHVDVAVATPVVEALASGDAATNATRVHTASVHPLVDVAARGPVAVLEAVIHEASAGLYDDEFTPAAESTASSATGHAFPKRAVSPAPPSRPPVALADTAQQQKPPTPAGPVALSNSHAAATSRAHEDANFKRKRDDAHPSQDEVSDDEPPPKRPRGKTSARKGTVSLRKRGMTGGEDDGDGADDDDDEGLDLGGMVMLDGQAKEFDKDDEDDEDDDVDVPGDESALQGTIVKQGKKVTVRQGVPPRQISQAEYDPETLWEGKRGVLYTYRLYKPTGKAKEESVYRRNHTMNFASRVTPGGTRDGKRVNLWRMGDPVAQASAKSKPTKLSNYMQSVVNGLCKLEEAVGGGSFAAIALPDFAIGNATVFVNKTLKKSDPNIDVKLAQLIQSTSNANTQRDAAGVLELKMELQKLREENEQLREQVSGTARITDSRQLRSDVASKRHTDDDSDELQALVNSIAID